jgi:hypothetical protein
VSGAEHQRPVACDCAAAWSGTSPQSSIVVVIVIGSVGGGGAPVAKLPGSALRGRRQPARGRHWRPPCRWGGRMELILISLSIFVV